MLYYRLKPGLLILAGLLFLLLQGCSLAPLQSDRLLEKIPSEFKKPVELDKVSFNPQLKYDCGPAALATLLQWQGIDISSKELEPEVYLPGRKGSLQLELLAATRQHNLIPYLLDKKFTSLLKEIKAGHPVLVLQNLALEAFPQWHYAVVIGYDLENDELILRTGDIRRYPVSISRFEYTWQRSDYWGFVVLKNGDLPASGNAFSYLKSILPFEQLGKTNFALRAYKVGLTQWPDDKNLLMASANAAYHLHKNSEAENFYHAIIKKWPDYGPAYNNLAQLYIDGKKYREAEALLNQAIALGDRFESEYRKTLQSISKSQQSVE